MRAACECFAMRSVLKENPECWTHAVEFEVGKVVNVRVDLNTVAGRRLWEAFLRSYFTMYMSSEGRGHGHGRDDDRGSDRADHPDNNHGRGSW